MKKLLVIVLCVAMMLTVLPGVAMAAVPSSPIPGANVTLIDPAEIADPESPYYQLFGNTGTATPQAAVHFQAKEDGEAAEANGYGDWITDFYISFSGINGDSLVGNENCYMVGKLWGFSRMIPLDGVEVVEGTKYPIVEPLAGAPITYYDVCAYIEEFTAGLYIDPEILEQHPNLSIDLSLRATDNENEYNYMTVGPRAFFQVTENGLGGRLMVPVASFSPAPPPADPEPEPDPEPTEPCLINQHRFDPETSNKCAVCGLAGTIVEPSTEGNKFTLAAAISAGNAENNILLLKKGAYEINGIINITNAQKGLTIIGQGEETVIKQTTNKKNMFVIGDSSQPTGSTPLPVEFTMVNMTLDGNNNANAIIYGKYQSVTNLYSIIITNRNHWSHSILLDNGNTPYYEDSITTINAYDVILGKQVEINACPRDGDTSPYVTYAAFNYVGGNIDEVGIVEQGVSRGFSNLFVNGQPFNIAVAFVNCDDSTTNYKKIEAAITAVNNHEESDGTCTINLLENVVINADANMTRGTLDLNGKTLTVNEGKTFTFAGASVGNGNLVVNGEIVLANADATVTAPSGLNITTNVADSAVVYVDGVYKVVAASAVDAKIGTTNYASFSDAFNAAVNGDTIEVFADCSDEEEITVNEIDLTFSVDNNSFPYPAISAANGNTVITKTTEGDVDTYVIDYTAPAPPVIIWPVIPDPEPEQKPDHEVYVPCDGGEDCLSDGFIDLDHDQWYHDAVDFVLQSKLMHGTGENKFSPEATTTRAMVWAMLARHAGEDTGSDWDADGQNWAVASGISDGLGGSDNITREQVIAMLWRYAGRPAVSGDLSAFNDADKVSDWAKEAMAWAIAEGIIKGDGSGAINPTGVATRAEVAQIFLNRFGK